MKSWIPRKAAQAPEWKWWLQYVVIPIACVVITASAVLLVGYRSRVETVLGIEPHTTDAPRPAPKTGSEASKVAGGQTVRISQRDAGGGDSLSRGGIDYPDWVTRPQGLYWRHPACRSELHVVGLGAHDTDGKRAIENARETALGWMGEFVASVRAAAVRAGGDGPEIDRALDLGPYREGDWWGSGPAAWDHPADRSKYHLACLQLDPYFTRIDKTNIDVAGTELIELVKEHFDALAKDEGSW